MADAAAPPGRCGIDSVEIARIERLLAETPRDGLARFWSEQELADAGDGPGRAASLAARFAAKEACAKLFPRETALGQIIPEDFSVRRDNYGAPQVVAAPNAAAAMGRHRIGGIALSLRTIARVRRRSRSRSRRPLSFRWRVACSTAAFRFGAP